MELRQRRPPIVLRPRPRRRRMPRAPPTLICPRLRPMLRLRLRPRLHPVEERAVVRAAVARADVMAAEERLVVMMAAGKVVGARLRPEVWPAVQRRLVPCKAMQEVRPIVLRPMALRRKLCPKLRPRLCSKLCPKLCLKLRPRLCLKLRLKLRLQLCLQLWPRPRPILRPRRPASQGRAPANRPSRRALPGLSI